MSVDWHPPSEIEQWRPIPGFEDQYEASNHGRIRSLDRIIRDRLRDRFVRGRILRPAPSPSGHLSVVLGRKIGSKGVRLLIALAFLGPRPFGMEVRHLNGIATDNRLENLEYATRSRNIQDKKWHAGQKNYRLSVQSVRDIKRRLANTRITEVAREYGVSVSTIWNIKRNHIHRDVVP